MSDFLSNLIARSFTDASMIQPRVPSLFEPTADEFSDEAKSSTPTIAAPETAVSTSAPPPVSKSLQIPQPRARKDEERKPELETSKVIVPMDSFRGEEKNADDKKRVLEAFSESRRIRPRSRKDFLPIEQRASKSAPIIRVTIGRVEVRAVQQSEPAPRAARREKPQPRLTLEEYLLQRRQGKR